MIDAAGGVNLNFSKELIEDLLKKQNLKEEELTEPGGVNCFRKLKKIIIKAVASLQIDAAKDEVDKIYYQALDKISNLMAIKKKLLEEINKKIEEASDLPEDKEKIAKFLTQFDQFIDSLRRKESYEAEIEKVVESGEVSDNEDEGLAELNKIRLRRGLPKRKKKI